MIAENVVVISGSLGGNCGKLGCDCGKFADIAEVL